MSDYPQNTKKGEQKRRYKAVYNQKALRLGLWLSHSCCHARELSGHAYCQSVTQSAP